jgi:predicted nucleic acid-binding protein
MSLPDTLVVDASVGVKLFLEEDGSREAEGIFSLLAGDSPRILAVPDLFFVECANVFRSRVHRRLMKPAAARDAFGILRALPLA